MTITDIESGSFIKLPNLSILYLHNNNLSTIHQDIFDIASYKNIYFFVGGNPLQCDSNLCWLKQAEQRGRIILNFLTLRKPNCNGIPWDNFTLDCHKKGKLFPLLFFILLKSYCISYCCISNLKEK